MLRTVGVAFKTVARSTVRHSSQCGVNPLLATQAKQSTFTSITSNTTITPANTLFAPIKSEPIFKSKFQLNEANPIPTRFLINWENTINNYKEENPQNNIEYQMESVKRKRKRKMNKHKLRKRRKAQKALMKKLGRA
eukprot:TRINITY_DN6031_c0_g1_i1.p1 TRINITY_DN6031_c0_g1~~TRINITY_DN6031_c0_g1_i1.p1  ORF type:complete len:137 (+),score=19.04 TRINITY_DN6031_c0_g1_i1:38-448(+)